MPAAVSTAPAARGRRGRGRGAPGRREDTAFGLTLVAPQVIGYVLFGLVPIVQVAYYSLQEINPLSGESRFVGFDNYRDIIASPTMHTVFRVTAIYVFAMAVSGVLLALGLALLLNSKLPFVTFFRSVYFLPALVTLAAWTIVWRFILQPSGLAGSLLSAVGLGQPQFLFDKNWALFSVVLVQVLKNVGINMMLFLAALQTVPQELVEAARIDGAGTWTVLRRVTLPQIAPSIIMVTILMTVGSFKVFEQILLMTNGGPGQATSVLSFEIYQQAFGASEIGYASALAMFLFVLVTVITVLIWQVRKRVVFHEAE